MESNISGNEVLCPETPPEPHFDEEATLLSARPVVPLHEVRAEARFGRRIIFGLTIIAALMLGGLGATLIYKRVQRQTTAVVKTSSPASEQAVPEGAAVTQAGGAKSDPHAAAAAPTSGNSDEVVTPQVHNAGTASTKTSRRGESSSDEREIRRIQRAEARRLRRTTERESRRDARPHKIQSSDDLLRIREIFEGTPKP